MQQTPDPSMPNAMSGQYAAGQSGQTAASATGADPSSDPNDPNNIQNATPAQQKETGADKESPHAVGTVQDANEAAQDENPLNPQEVSPEEQAQYEQFVSRFVMFISDDGSKRHPANGPSNGPSPSDAVLKMLNNPRVPLAVAIGTTVAHVAFLMVQTAKAQKVQYSTDVLFHANAECTTMMYLLGLSAGIFKGVPPFKGLEPDGSYDFTPQEVRIITDAQIQAVRAFGNMEVKAGLITPEVQQANLQFWKQQVAREVKSGLVTDETMNRLVKSGHLKSPQSAGTAGQVAPQVQQGQSQGQGQGLSQQPQAQAQQQPQQPLPPSQAASGPVPPPSANPTDQTGGPSPQQQ